MHRSGKLRSSLRGLVVGSLGLGCLLMANVGLAQETDAEKVFGLAVHQYFAGEYSEAISDLSLALDGGAVDPRLYYYRGLAKLQQGDEEAAKSDFMAGAKLEARFDGQRNFNVGRSLMRVQGATRMMIEEARAEAKASVASDLAETMPLNRRAALAALKAQLEQSEVESDGSSAPVALPRPNLPDLSGVNDPMAPFSDAPAIDPASESPVLEQPAQPAPAMDDPFAEPTGNASPPMDDPFGEPANGTPAAAPADDPFAEPGNAAPAEIPASDDPFAEPASETPAGDDPFAEPPAKPASDDPFAEPAKDTTAGNGSSVSSDVRPRKVFASLLGALTAPVRKAAAASAKTVHSLGPGVIPAGNGPEMNGPGMPSNDDPFGDDPFGDN